MFDEPTPWDRLLALEHWCEIHHNQIRELYQLLQELSVNQTRIADCIQTLDQQIQQQGKNHGTDSSTLT